MDYRKEKGDFLASLKYALRGVREGYTRELHVRKQVWVFIVVVLLAVILRITLLELGLIIVISALVLGLEMMNTALEGIEDIISPEYREAIRVSKDIAAGSVLIAGLAAIVIGGIIFLPHIAKLL